MKQCTWSEEARKKAREYMRKWREVNKEKTKQYNKNYWEKKVAEEQTAS